MLVTRICTYLTFKDILVLTYVNKRLYFATGDISLLRSYNQPNDRQPLGVTPNRDHRGYEYRIVLTANEISSSGRQSQYACSPPKRPPDLNSKSIGPPSGYNNKT